jgi:Rad3-related DNA helicase
MSEAVANAIADNDTVIVEAGTGTGKTYAYLVPAMLWGGRSSFRPVPRTCRTSFTSATFRRYAMR